jgi:hypothetical protein
MADKIDYSPIKPEQYCHTEHPDRTKYDQPWIGMLPYRYQPILHESYGVLPK